MWIHRLWIEFPKWCAPNGKYIKIHKSNDPPCLGSIRTWVTCFWVNMLLYIYPSLSLFHSVTDSLPSEPLGKPIWGVCVCVCVCVCVWCVCVCVYNKAVRDILFELP